MSEIPSSPEGEHSFKPALDAGELVAADDPTELGTVPAFTYEEEAMQEWQERHKDALSQLTEEQQAEAYDVVLWRLRVQVARGFDAWYEQNEEALSKLPRKQQVAAYHDATVQLCAQGVPEHILPVTPGEAIEPGMGGDSSS